MLTNIYFNRLRTNLSLAQPTGVWTNRFGWDAAKRLTNVISQAGSFTNEYFPGVAGASGYSSSLIKRLLLPNLSIITNITNDYDSVGRQLGTWLKTSTGTALDYYIYTYNPANQRTNVTRTDSSTVAFQYDGIGQLKVANSSVNTEDCGYNYDAAWNLHYRTKNGVLSSATVDGKNQMTAFAGNNYLYDDNGNISEGPPGGYRTYTYDDENRLTSVQVLSTWRSEFVYDGLGRMRKHYEYTWNGSSWVSSSSTGYVYDGMRVIQERNPSTSLSLVSYTRGNDLSGTLEGAGGIGGLLARSSGYSLSTGNWSTHYFYHADGNGNITYMVDTNQALAASYRYDPFGNTVSSSGTLATAKCLSFFQQRIPGQQRDVLLPLPLLRPQFAAVD